MTNELRWNPLTLRWVAIAPTRATRPIEGSDAPRPGPPDRSDPDCPFCPGNEAELPDILWELPSDDAPGWSVRAVPNRFSAFTTDASERRQPPFRSARGHQEVLIESPIHSDDFSEMSTEHLDRVLTGYRRRYAELFERPGVSRILLFRNRGRLAGNSLRHPHAQLVALELDPPEMQTRDAAFRRLRDENDDTCPLCDPDAFEPVFGKRRIHQGEHFTAWVPWAAEAPFEVWITPRIHLPDFHIGWNRSGEREFASVLAWVTRRYRDVAGDPDYNLLLHSAGPDDSGAFHWWVRLRPRVGLPAGLELLSGVLVNPSSPEDDAALLGTMPSREPG